MNHFEKVFQCFPDELQNQLDTLERSVRDAIEEIRIYKGKGVVLSTGGRKIRLRGNLGGTEMNNLLSNLMKFSYYAYEEDLARGFITIDGGHRVGVCGKTVMEKGKVTLIRDISSLNIRWCREVPGCSDRMLSQILDQEQIHNTLIVSPPGCGKTTLLRDITRNLSYAGFNVSVCDERAEIAGMYSGVSAYDLGPNTDVLDGCPKAEGIVMLVRSMSPQVIVTDEISKAEDADAIRTCMGSGVKVIATAHGSSRRDLEKTEIYGLVESGVFSRLIFLTDKPKVGTVKEVIHV